MDDKEDERGAVTSLQQDTILSQSQRNLLGILSLADGAALTIEQAYRRRARNKTVIGLCERVHQATDQAMNKFGLVIVDKRSLAELERRITEFDNATFANQEHSASVLISTALGLLDEPLRHIRNKDRLAALERLERALVALHRYFDRCWDRHEEYEIATRYCGRW